MTAVPFSLVFIWKKGELSDPPTAAETLAHSTSFSAALYTGVVAGIVLTVYYTIAALSILRKNVSVGSANDRGTAVQKRAGTKKIQKMLDAATEMHTESENTDLDEFDLTDSKKLDLTKQSDPVFQTYVLHGEGREDCGSWAWVFTRLLRKDLFEEEGIWLPSRLWVFQCMQIVVYALFLLLIKFFIEEVMVLADEATAELPDDLPSWIYSKFGKQKSGMMSLEFLCLLKSIDVSFPAGLVPTSEDVRIACVPSAVISLIVMAMIILLYIPRCVL